MMMLRWDRSFWFSAVLGPALLPALLLAIGGGCATGSLATDTGVSSEGVWSTAAVHTAHVGEKVGYSFILREPFKEGRLSLWGLADYAALSILDARVEAEPNIESRFEFEHVLPELHGKRTVTVLAEAFKIRGRKDYLELRGRWMMTQDPTDLPDERVAKDAIKLRTYQSEIDYTFDKPIAPLDWSGARLLITRRDGKGSTVFMDRAGRAGFTKNGPDHRGRYRIQYYPKAEQVNKTGTTAAALHVWDVNGQQHTYQFEFDTP